MSNLRTYYHFKLDFRKSGPTYRRQVVNPGNQTPQGESVAKFGIPIEYPSRECKHDIKESEGSMFSPIFKENVRDGNIISTPLE